MQLLLLGLFSIWVAIAFPEMGGLKGKKIGMKMMQSSVAIAFPEMGGLKDFDNE